MFGEAGPVRLTLFSESIGEVLFSPVFVRRVSFFYLTPLESFSRFPHRRLRKLLTSCFAAPPFFLFSDPSLLYKCFSILRRGFFPPPPPLRPPSFFLHFSGLRYPWCVTNPPVLYPFGSCTGLGHPTGPPPSSLFAALSIGGGNFFSFGPFSPFSLFWPFFFFFLGLAPFFLECFS